MHFDIVIIFICVLTFFRKITSVVSILDITSQNEDENNTFLCEKKCIIGAPGTLRLLVTFQFIKGYLQTLKCLLVLLNISMTPIHTKK